MDKLKPESGWVEVGRVRLPAPPVAARGFLFRAVSRLSGVLGRDEMPDILAVLHLNPHLFWAWLFFASRLMPYGRLVATEREKIILRTAWNCRSRYEWGQHVELALAAGVSDDEIQRVAEGSQAWADPHDRALMLACDELCRDRFIAEATWQILAQKYSDSLLVEITILIGHYEMIAGFLNSAGIELEPAIEAKLQAFYARIAKV